MAGLVSVSLVAGVSFVAFNLELPPVAPLRQTTFVCPITVTNDCGPANAMASFSAEEDRVYVPLDRIPSSVVDAVLAAEDRDFFSHSGIDPVGIARALVDDLRNRGARQGGSTITQQYVKTVYLGSERTVTRKIKEAVLAMKLERELSKDQILERYLNTVYFGRGAYGVAAAARAYFGSDLAALDAGRAAYLAGLIRAPERADATRHPEEAERRRRVVLDAMVDTGSIDAAIRDAARSTPLVDQVVERRDRTGSLGRVVPEGVGAEYFVDWIQQTLVARYGESLVYGGGLRVYTSLDPGLQRAAWDAVTSNLDRPDDPSAALVALDEQGYVRAMVGGTDFATRKVNLALGTAGGGSGRGAGSSFKPFVLARALEQGISLDSRFESRPSMVFPGADDGKDWKVRNYDQADHGVVDLVEATTVSSNTAYAQLMLEVGPAGVVELAHRLGISAELPPVSSLALGTAEVSVLDMATAYSTLASRGVRNEPVAITRVERVGEDGSVTVLDQARPAGEQVLAPEVADRVTYCLQSVVREGTGKAAALDRPVAGKTGTTQDNRDAWFAGYTPGLTAVVWMGYPDAGARSMDDVHGRAVTGGSFPAEIWHDFMAGASAALPDEGFPTASDLDAGRALHPELASTTTTVAPTTTSPDPIPLPTSQPPPTTGAPEVTVVEPPSPAAEPGRGAPGG